jgi:hypothetical protein
MANTTSKRTFYMVQGLPAGIFGEAYVVIASMEPSHGLFRTEQFILTQRPKETLHMEAFEVDGNTFPVELGKVDLNFVMLEGLVRAGSKILELLEERSADLGRPELAFSKFELVLCPSPLVGCKMRGRFVQHLTSMKEATGCPNFAIYLGFLDQVAVVG